MPAAHYDGNTTNASRVPGPHSFNGRTGLSLLELLLAFAIFAIIFAAGMQAYISSYTGNIIQEQRTQAMQLARSVINNLRELRDEPGGAFPDRIIAQYPPGEPITDVRSLEASALQGRETITIEYADLTANPLAVRVIVEWLDPRNRPMIFDVTTMLTDR